MRKQHLPAAQVQTNFVSALADLIEHPDCPPEMYGDLIKLVENWDNKFCRENQPTEEARRIRKNLPQYFKQLVE